MHSLTNGQISIGVEAHGAELRSLKDEGSGMEYMWSGDPEFWGEVSPILFPIVGSFRGGQTVYQGAVYSMSQHGFARDREFAAEKKGKDGICFTLESDEDTRSVYPFDFRLQIGYYLKERTVRVEWTVENTGQEKMYFSIGGHPGFLCPLEGRGSKTDCRLRFDCQDQLVCRNISPDALAENSFTEHVLDQGELAITDTLFYPDALVMENGQVHQISLIDGGQKPYVTVNTDAPVVGIWSPQGSEGPVVCIEPWYGRCDRVDFEGTFDQREWGQSLEAGAVFRASYTITI